VANEPDASTFVPKVPTVSDPERTIRYISLAESLAIALERGRIGTQGGIPNDNLVSFAGRGDSSSDAIRVLSLDPAIVGADIEASLAKFDARFNSSLTWNTTDRPVGTALDQFQAGGVGAIKTEAADFRTSLLKPLPTGGVAGITFDVPYQFTNLASRVNPSYTPSLQFQFEQPLLQGFGVEINQLRGTHPGSVLTPFPTGGRVEGILITRIRFDQQRAEFEREVDNQLLNVETAYWNLYSAYYGLYARDLGLRQALEIWKITHARVQIGKDDPASDPQAQGTYEQFRNQRLTALGLVLESERRLRLLMGLPVEDGTRLVPADVPTLAKNVADWNSAVQETLALRPELVLARQDLKFRQLDLINQKNLLLPDVRSRFTYDINAIGSRLDGPDAHNAFRALSSDHFNNWAAGLTADIPIGFRDANSAVRVARLNLTRSYRTLREQEERAIGFLALEFRNLDEFHTQIGIQRSLRETYARELDIRVKRVKGQLVVADINLLTALTNYANALASEYSFIAQYNVALANFEFAKGTIMQRDNVQIGEGQLTNCAAVRAVDHEQERSKALILRERENPVAYTPCKVGDAEVVLPDLPKDRAPSLPSLLEKAPMPTTELLSRTPQSSGSEPATSKSAPPPPTTAKPTLELGNNLPYAPSGVGVTRVGLSGPVPVGIGAKSRVPEAANSEADAKVMPTGTPVDTKWTPRP
jgi:outer membrane protein TolC